jgi:putative oxidoreductase
MEQVLHKSTGGALLFGRIAIAAVFIPSGFSKLMNLDGFIASLDGRGVPMASILGPLGAMIEFLAGIAVLVGIHVRFASVLMILFTVAATLIAHRFWEFEGAARTTQQSQFFKNLAIVGGYVFLIVNGGGRYCVDRLWRGGDMRRVVPGRRAADQGLPAYGQR